MNEILLISQEIKLLVDEWEPKLLSLPEEVISQQRNVQNRTIKQILGHLVDSASNNTHRIVHLQYQPSPLIFPDYAHHGNNERWIMIQNYQDENWYNLIQLWKYSNLHFAHIIQYINSGKLANVWPSALNEQISLKSMVLGYPNHFKLHCNEINQLINKDFGDEV